jgi:hypothetical protein
MTLTNQIAKHLREVHVGKNWSWSNLKDNLEGLTWEQATTSLHGLNTIAKLVFHINYYICAVTKVLHGGTLDAHDKFSFDCPPITNQETWDKLVQKSLNDAETFARLIEAIPDEKLNELFVEEKYGTWYRNLAGIIEHTHYHLGQIAIIKKMVQAG